MSVRNEQQGEIQMPCHRDRHMQAHGESEEICRESQPAAHTHTHTQCAPINVNFMWNCYKWSEWNLLECQPMREGERAAAAAQLRKQ